MGRTTFKKIITSPETIEKINPDNKKLIKLFLKDKGRKCSDATIKQYTSALNIFFCWVVNEADNKFYPEIKKIEISQFFDYLLDEMKINGKRFSFFKSLLSNLSDTVIKFYDEDERCKTFRNFIGAIIDNIPKSDAREKTVLEEEQLNDLLETLDLAGRYQESCLVALAVYSGMRISELVQAKISWFDEEHIAYELFYETPKMRTKGAGKAGKVISRLILHDAFKPYLEKWLIKRANILKEKQVEAHDMLFINKQGQPATEIVLRGFLPKWEKILGVNLYFHQFRHLFTTTLKTKYKLSDEIVKTLMRWSSVDLVSLYNDKSGEIDMEELEVLKNNLK